MIWPFVSRLLLLAASVPSREVGIRCYKNGLPDAAKSNPTKFVGPIARSLAHCLHTQVAAQQLQVFKIMHVQVASLFLASFAISGVIAAPHGPSEGVKDVSEDHVSYLLSSQTGTSDICWYLHNSCVGHCRNALPSVRQACSSTTPPDTRVPIARKPADDTAQWKARPVISGLWSHVALTFVADSKLRAHRAYFGAERDRSEVSERARFARGFTLWNMAQIRTSTGVCYVCSSWVDHAVAYTSIIL